MSTVFARNTVPETQTPSADPVFRAMSELRKDGFGWEDIYARLTKAGLAVTKAECRRFVIPKARRPGGASGALCRLGGRDDPTQD